MLSRLISILSSYKPNVLKIWTSLFFACRQYRTSAYRVQNVVLCHEQRVIHQAEQSQEKLHWITCTWPNTIDANFVSFAKGEALHVNLMDTNIPEDFMQHQGEGWQQIKQTYKVCQARCAGLRDCSFNAYLIKLHSTTQVAWGFNYLPVTRLMS